MADNDYFCNECLTVMSKKHSNITLNHEDIGTYTVVNVIHYACDTCGDKIVPREYVMRIESEEASLRIINALNEVHTLTLYEICESLELNINFVNKIAEKLEKEGKVFFDVSKELPEVSLIEDTTNSSWFNKLAGLLK